MSTVLDALKKIQSDRDRGEASDSGALRRDVIGAVSPPPAKGRRVTWIAILAVVGMLATAAGYFLLPNGDETPAVAVESSASGESDARLTAALKRQGRSGDDARTAKAGASRRPAPAKPVTREGRTQQQQEQILARMQKNLGKGTRARRAAKASRAQAKAQLPVARKEPDSPSPKVEPDAGERYSLSETESSPPSPVIQAAPSPVVDAREEPNARKEQAGDWEAGAGSVRMAARTPEPRSPSPEPAPAVKPVQYVEAEPAPHCKAFPG